MSAIAKLNLASGIALALSGALLADAAQHGELSRALLVLLAGAI